MTQMILTWAKPAAGELSWLVAFLWGGLLTSALGALRRRIGLSRGDRAGSPGGASAADATGERSMN